MNITMEQELTMDKLKECFETAIKYDANYIGVKIQMQGFDKPEIIINESANFETKLAYYMKAYDENLILKTFSGIKIIGFTEAESFGEIEWILVDKE